MESSEFTVDISQMSLEPQVRVCGLCQPRTCIILTDQQRQTDRHTIQPFLCLIFDTMLQAPGYYKGLEHFALLTSLLGHVSKGLGGPGPRASATILSSTSDYGLIKSE